MGVKKILDFSQGYNIFQQLVGAEKFRRLFINQYIKPLPGTRILDIGCGTAEILAHLPAVEYFGFDLSEKYIADARERYGDRGHFECRRINDKVLSEYDRFDLVLAIGVLHHLDDQEAKALFALAEKALKPGGRLITLDGCYAEKQSKLARWIISHDRGQYVRPAEEYRRLAGTAFSSVEMHVRNDLLYIPYTHVILTCEK